MSSLSRPTPRKRVPYLLLTGIIIPLICLVPFSTGVYAEETGLPIATTTYAKSEPASEDEDLDLYLTYAQSISTTFNSIRLRNNNQTIYYCDLYLK